MYALHMQHTCSQCKKTYCGSCTVLVNQSNFETMREYFIFKSSFVLTLPLYSKALKGMEYSCNANLCWLQ